ncbi:MAG: hypothetical protein FJW95_11975 [Actinobacteria bacterium]|nr:hypothetical protein [Actinomycetota bacterium]
MARALTPGELTELLGAYALDAVDGDERAQVEAWLARSPAARRDADELIETASLLAESAEAPSVDLWSRIESHLGDPVDEGAADGGAPVPMLRFGGEGREGAGAQVVDLAARRDATTPAASPRRRRPWLGIAAALALVIAVSVGVFAGTRIADQDQRIDQLAVGMEKRAMERAALAATMEPGSRTAELAAGDGAMMAKVVVSPEGRGYFMTDAMPELPRGRTYQLWAVMGDAPGSAIVSAGVMGREPGVMAFTTDAGVTRFVVTEEEAPGVARSVQPALISGTLA